MSIRVQEGPGGSGRVWWSERISEGSRESGRVGKVWEGLGGSRRVP